jgi:hypothetical protein
MKRFGKVLVAVTAAVAMTGIGSVAAGAVIPEQGEPEELHCPDHNDPENTKFEGATGNETLDGVNFDWDGTDLTVTNTNDFGVTVIWCAKGGVNFIDGEQTTGIVQTHLGPGESVDLEFDQAISYIVIYDIIPDDENDIPDDEEEEEEEEEEEVKEEEPEVAVAVKVEPVFTG